jgi:hypothetical protein
MGFRIHRSVRVLPGIRLNFGKRGISTSIGVRGAHITFGRTGTRTTVGLPGTGLSYTHMESRRPTVSRITAQPRTDPNASQPSAARGFLWTALIVAILLSALGRLMTPATPLQFPAPTRTTADTAAQAAARTAMQERSAEIKSAALGVTQIRHAIANSNTLTISRVTMMPSGTICYQFHLQNSRGITYARSAMTQGAELKVSGSDGYAPQWNHRCAAQTEGHDITPEVQSSVRH